LPRRARATHDTRHITGEGALRRAIEIVDPYELLASRLPACAAVAERLAEFMVERAAA
jgi:hypothetical protein